MSTVHEAAATVNADAMWLDACQRVSAQAQARLPESLHGRIQRATALVITKGVWFEDDGHTCQVRASDGQTWYSANGSCPCEDHQRAPEHLCKHRLGRMIYLRAGELLREGLVLDLEPTPAAHGIRPEHLVDIQGKTFVRYAGLLAMAHERGLVELTATWTHNEPSLSLAEAVASFKNGGHYRESGDATPENVTKKVAPHFRRVALTRAKARVLRDALGVDLCAVEELMEGE